MPRRRTTRPSGPRHPSGRQRHDEKITVYVSPSELVDLEHARLVLRADHSLAVDRGRIVREALAVVLADLEAKGEQSILVRRLAVPLDAAVATRSMLFALRQPATLLGLVLGFAASAASSESVAQQL